MPSSNSISTQPGSTHQTYQYENGINESSENQWSPDTTNTHGEPTPLQWPTMPLHIVPVNSNGISTPYDTNNVSIPGVNTPIDLDDPHSFSQINPPQNGYSMLNAPRMTYGSGGSSVLMTPSSQNPMLTPKTCMTPVSSTSQFKNRAPSWIVTRHVIAKKPKRIRTAFTSHQVMQLEREYTRSHYLDRSRRIELSKILGLNERTIKIWFQNRRMKEKKEKAESMEDSEETTESSPEHGNIPMQMAVHHDYPTPVADALYKQDVVYLESYPEKPMTQLVAPHTMNGQMMNAYNYEYPQEQHLAFEYRQMQLQNEASVYGNQVQDMQMCPQFSEEPPQAADQGTVNTLLMSDVQNTDLSWIRNIYPEEE